MIKLIAWPAGASMEVKRLHVALVVKCEGDCKSLVKKAYDVFAPLDDKPILTWSDFFEGFVLAARFPKPLESVKAFCREAEGKVVDCCEVLSGATELDGVDSG